MLWESLSSSKDLDWYVMICYIFVFCYVLRTVSFCNCSLQSSTQLEPLHNISSFNGYTFMCLRPVMLHILTAARGWYNRITLCTCRAAHSTFTDLLNCVIKTTQAGGVQLPDRHWEPLTTRCGLCDVQYDYIGM